MSFTSEQKIRFDDVDGAGIVYYPRFFHMCHKAFEDCFDELAQLSYPTIIAKEKKGFPTVKIVSEFFSPLVYGDSAIVEMNIKRIGNSSLDTSYEISRKADRKVCFTALVTTVYIDLLTKKSIPITQYLRSFLESLAVK